MFYLQNGYHMKALIIVAVVLLCFPATAVMTNKEHIKFCNDYKNHGNDWLALAKEGYVEYQFKLGDLWRIRSTRHEGYYRTHTVYCPLKHSPEFWMREAAENGHPDAQFGVAKILLEILRNKEFEKAETFPFDLKCEAETEIRHFLTLSKEQGHKKAGTELALVYGGNGYLGQILCVENGREICAELLNEQARNEDKYAQELLSTWYGHKAGCVDESPLNRLLWLNVLAINGDTSAANRINVPILNAENDYLKPYARRLAKECLRTKFQNCDTSEDIIILPEQRPNLIKTEEVIPLK